MDNTNSHEPRPLVGSSSNLATNSALPQAVPSKFRRRPMVRVSANSGAHSPDPSESSGEETLLGVAAPCMPAEFFANVQREAQQDDRSVTPSESRTRIESARGPEPRVGPPKTSARSPEMGPRRLEMHSAAPKMAPKSDMDRLSVNPQSEIEPLLTGEPPRRSAVDSVSGIMALTIAASLTLAIGLIWSVANFSH